MGLSAGLWKNVRVPMAPTDEFFQVPLGCRCLFDPGAEAVSPYGVLALHGYGMTPEIMLALTRKLLGPRPFIGALAAPHQHYAALGPQAATVYNWGTRHHWPDAIRLHHAMVDEGLARLAHHAALEPGRLVLLGFSQPVGLGYRYALARPGRVRGVVGLCGGVPGDWESLPGDPVSAALLHVARSEDEFYPPSAVGQFESRLRARAADVEYHLLPGPHRFPSQAADLTNRWLARLGLL